MPSLLAVDLGLRTGLALFGEHGKLIWYRSHNYGTTERLKQGVPAILGGDNAPTVMVIEGGGNLATVWEKEADRRGIVRYRILCASRLVTSSTSGTPAVKSLNRRIITLARCR
jgi:hypothetical protein